MLTAVTGALGEKAKELTEAGMGISPLTGNMLSKTHFEVGPIVAGFLIQRPTFAATIAQNQHGIYTTFWLGNKKLGPCLPTKDPAGEIQRVQKFLDVIQLTATHQPKLYNERYMLGYGRMPGMPLFVYDSTTLTFSILPRPTTLGKLHKIRPLQTFPMTATAQEMADAIQDCLKKTTPMCDWNKFTHQWNAQNSQKFGVKLEKQKAYLYVVPLAQNSPLSQISFQIDGKNLRCNMVGLLDVEVPDALPFLQTILQQLNIPQPNG